MKNDATDKDFVTITIKRIALKSFTIEAYKESNTP